jgi:predicted RecB family nuclease
MSAIITADVLEARLQCRYKAHLRLARQTGDRSDYEALMAETREQVRNAATEMLLARHSGDEVLCGATLTPELLRRQVPLLLDAVVEGNGLAVRFDALQLQASAPKSSERHYVPVLFHECVKPGRQQRTYLEILGVIVGAAQGREPDWGVLIHGPACEKRRVKLGGGRAGARRIIAAIQESQQVGGAPRLMLNSHCQVCEFRKRCHAEAITKDDLSLLRSINEKEIAQFARRGILTVTQLAYLFRPRKKSKRSTRQGQPHYHTLQALAIREKKIFVLGTPELPDSPVHVYLDIEGDPERRFDYLLGMIVQAGGIEERHSFWADTPADEIRLFRQFLDVLSKYDDFRLYCYGRYEGDFLRRMIRASGQADLGDRLLSRLLNVLSIVRQHIYFPTFSNALKEIGAYLGVCWTHPGASGVQSIVWRRRWEQTASADLREQLTAYNMDDCAALRKVTECLYVVCRSRPGVAEPLTYDGHPVSGIQDSVPRFRRPDFCKADFTIADFAFANDRAYFDYQRDRVYLRTNRALRRNLTKRLRKRGKKNLRPNRNVVIAAQVCPGCAGRTLTLTADGRLARLAYDFRVGRGGLRRWVTRFTTHRHDCAGCGLRFLPEEYVRLREHGHALMAWAMYKHIAHRASFVAIAEEVQDCFRMPVHDSDIHAFKGLMACYYAQTYRGLLAKIVAGPLVHADETEVVLRDLGKGYVWVFTNMEEVVFMYKPSRDGAFLDDLLGGFSGVLVSDFYAAYDSLSCPQQKCLVHLIRDLNQDLKANPWDDELKGLASDFGKLLRAIVATIDQCGLKVRHLRKHLKAVRAFYDGMGGRDFRSEVAEGYRKRLMKNRDKLFTFLRYDGVPWNNNNAEHAIKKFAAYRETADTLFNETGLNNYLVLLSLCLSCKYKGVSFLRFLLSGQTDIDAFRDRSGKRVLPPIELYPTGAVPTHSSRRKLIAKAQKRQD